MTCDYCNNLSNETEICGVNCRDMEDEIRRLVLFWDEQNHVKGSTQIHNHQTSIPYLAIRNTTIHQRNSPVQNSINVTTRWAFKHQIQFKHIEALAPPLVGSVPIILKASSDSYSFPSLRNGDSIAILGSSCQANSQDAGRHHQKSEGRSERPCSHICGRDAKEPVHSSNIILEPSIIPAIA